MRIFCGIFSTPVYGADMNTYSLEKRSWKRKRRREKKKTGKSNRRII
jgi:hypothetical protein